ncbi:MULTISPECIES: winged helix-turn-helix domain-containing protein [unclassified Vibrio]|uniref:winged helix-turn-helix domain-containing protein n=1 Tax=unclassified Vibrio TaxID=2614977 RepID=UPI0013612B84|nr:MULTISPECIES: winged helix-turn-helix domain-containing protein [unclassified Vibrio]NAW59148.1 hypothetical protein [Vibrio sp. V36_P2S2PM302]NAX27578.1 hypothetical protein [Vibrio sp. V38_P2S17PM301]
MTQKVTKNIIINGQVVFDPKANRLFSVAVPEAHITLPKPASRCLLILINHHGNVVTMAQFHEQAWNQNNVIVSDQSIYQNISLLRKALTKVGGSKNIIETQTRRGWVISNEILITEEKYNVNSEGNKNKEVGDNKEEDLSTDLPISKEPPSHYIPHHQKKRFIAYIVTLLFSVSVVFLSYALWTSYPVVHTWSLRTYQKLTNVSECQVFRNPSNIKDSAYIEFIQRNAIECNNYSWWYITNSIPTGYFSLISCKEPLLKKNSESPDCISYSFLGLKDDNKENQ